LLVVAKQRDGYRIAIAEQAPKTRRRSAWIIVGLTAIAVAIATLWLLLPLHFGS